MAKKLRPLEHYKINQYILIIMYELSITIVMGVIICICIMYGRRLNREDEQRARNLISE